MSALHFTWATCLVLVAMASRAAAAADPVTLAKGDRVVFFGDSITQGAVGPKGYITVLGKLLAEKHPELSVELIGAGISGHKVPDLQKRIDRDVLAKKPTIVVIYIGINDVWHGQKDPARGTLPEPYAAGLKEIIGKLQKAGSRVLLCTPSVIGEKQDGANPLDAKLDQYAELSRQVAAETSVPVCDLRKAFVEYLKTNNPKNADRGILTGDGVHLNEAGNRFVAETMLESLTPVTK